MLSESHLLRCLTERRLSPALFAVRETGSTNNDAKAFAGNDPVTPALFVADRQTAGRGRQGKTFVSPPGGLYMSLLLRPKVRPAGAADITGCAAVAVCRAIEACSGIRARIKWVNDILIPTDSGAEYGKAAGILCETAGDPGNPYLVIGIGINVTSAPTAEGANFPPAALFPSSSPSLSGHEAEELCAGVTDELLTMAEKGLRFADVSDEYRSRSIVTGRRVVFIRDGVSRAGLVRAIADDGSLLVETEEGTISLNSGEISVRLPQSPHPAV